MSTMTNGRLRDFYLDRGMLLKIHMDLLYACDLDCHHCYLDNKKRPQVSTPQIIDALTQAADMGAIQVTFSGGEIFLRKDLFEILDAARALRYHMRLKTHGGNLTRADAKRIATMGVAAVDFSVYALEDAPHDEFTKIPGSLQRTLRGIGYLQDEGVPVEVKCSVTTFNLHHYRALFAHFDDDRVKVTLNARVRGTNSITTDTYPLNLSHEDKVRVEIFKLEQHDGPRPKGAAPSPDQSHFCFAGRTALYIAPDLKVYPCTAYPVELGNLHDHSLRDIWTGGPELTSIRSATRADTGICSTCAARSHCSYCPGAAYIESNGNAVKPPEVICRDAFAKLEAEERYLQGERTQPHLQPRRRMSFPILNNAPSTHGCGS